MDHLSIEQCVRQWEACAEGTGIASLFVSLLCQPIFASLVIHGFNPTDSSIEDSVVRGHCQRNTGTCR